jgi:hypothetical protein
MRTKRLYFVRSFEDNDTVCKNAEVHTSKRTAQLPEEDRVGPELCYGTLSDLFGAKFVARLRGGEVIEILVVT